MLCYGSSSSGVYQAAALLPVPDNAFTGEALARLMRGDTD
jgi:hypothetical protein